MLPARRLHRPALRLMTTPAAQPAIDPVGGRDTPAVSPATTSPAGETAGAITGRVWPVRVARSRGGPQRPSRAGRSAGAPPRRPAVPLVPASRARAGIEPLRRP